MDDLSVTIHTHWSEPRVQKPSELMGWRELTIKELVERKTKGHKRLILALTAHS
jgi:hypothetical protein